MSVCFRAIWTATPTGGSWPNAPVDERRLNGRSRAAKLTFGVIECTADKDRPPYGPLSSEHLERRPRSTPSRQVPVRRFQAPGSKCRELGATGLSTHRGLRTQVRNARCAGARTVGTCLARVDASGSFSPLSRISPRASPPPGARGFLCGRDNSRRGLTFPSARVGIDAAACSCRSRGAMRGGTSEAPCLHVVRSTEKKAPGTAHLD